jgi:toxin ParE1/3/4
MLPIDLLPKARQDLDEAYAWYYVEAPDVAERFLRAVVAASQLLSDNPFLGRPRRFRIKGIRSWQVPGFRVYLIFYRPTETALQIVRVLHGARDLRKLLSD